MKLLLIAQPGDLAALAAHFAVEFEMESASDAPTALAILARRQVDALVVHLGIGDEPALDVLYGARKHSPDRAPGMVVVAETCELATAVAVMRAGAYDVQLAGSLTPGKLAHAVRNATLATKLSRHRLDPAR